MADKSSWLSLLQSVNAAPKAEPIPKGFKPLDDWLKEFDISETTWRRKVPILEEQGVMVRGYFRKIDATGRALKAPFWKKK